MSGNERGKGKHTDPQNQVLAIHPKPRTEQLRQIIENRFNDEPDKQLIKFLLGKAKLSESQFIDQLLRKMLLIKNHLLKSRLKDKKRIEEIILELLYDDSLTEGQLLDELLNNWQLIEKLLKDKQLIEKIFEETFVYIPRDPKLEGSNWLSGST